MQVGSMETVKQSYMLQNPSPDGGGNCRLAATAIGGRATNGSSVAEKWPWSTGFVQALAATN
jgi:hypothetical protein